MLKLLEKFQLYFFLLSIFGSISVNSGEEFSQAITDERLRSSGDKLNAFM